MSIRAIDWAFKQVILRNPTTKLILIKLADNANDEGLCWPSFDYLAYHCHIKRKNIPRHIKKLEALGLLKVQRRQRDGVNLPNCYALSLPVDKPVDKGRGGVSSGRGLVSSTGPRGVSSAGHLEPSVNLRGNRWEISDDALTIFKATINKIPKHSGGRRNERPT